MFWRQTRSWTCRHLERLESTVTQNIGGYVVKISSWQWCFLNIWWAQTTQKSGTPAFRRGSTVMHPLLKDSDFSWTTAPDLITSLGFFSHFHIYGKNKALTLFLPGDHELTPALQQRSLWKHPHYLQALLIWTKKKMHASSTNNNRLFLYKKIKRICIVDICERKKKSPTPKSAKKLLHTEDTTIY